MPINNLTVNLGAFKSSQIAVLSSITGNVSSISLSRGPGAPTNGGKCYLTVGGNINGAVNADAYNLYVTGSISGNVQCAGALTGAIQAGGNISGNITINGTSNSTGSIIATGNITGTVTIPNFTGTGNICAANLNVDNIFCMQPNILPTGANGVFSGTWTVCGDPPSGMPCPGTSPSPAHDATGVMITKRLSWTAGANTTAYKVYLGTDTSQMALIGSGPAANCVPPLLEPNTSYYWRVDAVNANGTVTGTVWQFTTAAAPTILYVDDDSTASPPDGQSWATAYPNLQDALTAVGTNTNYSLWVAAGTYTPGTLATSTFTMKNGLAIFGGFAGDENPATFDLGSRDFSANETILSGGNVVNHVVTVGNSVVDSVDDRTRLDGFTLAGGIGSRGAAVYAYKESGDIDCDMVFANCVIRDHSGDAVYTFTRHSMYVTYISEPTFMHCQFINNAGRAFYNQRSGVTVLDCTFIGNQSSQNGGVVYNYYTKSSTRFINCLFNGNAATGSANGGVAYQEEGNSQWTNCTFTGNQAGGTAGVLDNQSGGSVALRNCILWDNGSAPLSGTISVTNSCIEGGYLGNGNIDADPLFVDADGADDIAGTEDDDLRLLPESPCINAGDDTIIAGMITDLGGKLRVYGCHVDMGAYEYVRGDISLFDYDGDVDIDDVEAMNACVSGPGIPANPLCGDCNDNGIFDAREIAAGTLTDSDGDWIPDICDACPGHNDLEDADRDGIPDGCDNCLNVFNPDQADTDEDGVGDACDICAGHDDSVDTDNDGVPDGCDRCEGYDDHDDADNDGVPDDCDNCPNTYNPEQEDTDEDGLGDECDPDLDGDGILEDGDNSGIRYDNPCAHLQIYDCDDNCPWTYNPDQADTDGDGVGDACEALMMRMASPGGATASFMLHEGGRGNVVQLPAEGGTVVVDLEITHASALLGFEGWIGASVADVISIRAEDWTERDNVLHSYGVPGYSMASSYDFTIMEWYLTYPNGTAELGTDPAPLQLSKGTGVFTPAVDLSALDGLIDKAYGTNLYASSTKLSALLSASAPAGTTVPLTLTLDVAGVGGTYTLHFLGGFMVDESGARVALLNGDLATITVGGGQ